MRVPELADGAEPVEGGAALAETVKVLLAREHEAYAKTLTPGSIAHGLCRHARVGRLSEQPVAAGIEEGDAERRGRDLEAETWCHQSHGIAVHDVDRCRRPLAVGDIRGRRGRAARTELDPDDPRGEDGHGDRGVICRKSHGGRAEALEAGG